MVFLPKRSLEVTGGQKRSCKDTGLTPELQHLVMQFFAFAKMTEDIRDRNELKDPQSSIKVT